MMFCHGQACSNFRPPPCKDSMIVCCRFLELAESLQLSELLGYRHSHVFSIIIWVAARRADLAEPGPASFSLKRGFGSTLPRCGRVGHGETRSCSRAKPQRRVYHHNVTPAPTERHISLLSSACAGRP